MALLMARERGECEGKKWFAVASLHGIRTTVQGQSRSLLQGIWFDQFIDRCEHVMIRIG